MCGWCRHRTQTREHLFKNCLQWERQQKILWAEVRRETGRGKERFKFRDLFTDEGHSQAILDSLAITDVGRRIPDTAEEDAQREASEWGLRERNGREEERRLEAEELGAEVQERLQFCSTPSFGLCRR
jgi:hypothetical protein